MGMGGIISIHEVFADLDTITIPEQIINDISIHEVFADLDPIRANQ